MFTKINQTAFGIYISHQVGLCKQKFYLSERFAVKWGRNFVIKIGVS